jgi:pimeloyl-ACP methyl ester carboxylesterase
MAAAGRCEMWTPSMRLHRVVLSFSWQRARSGEPLSARCKMHETVACDNAAIVATDPLIPTIILLPGLDGTGKLFNRFVLALGANVDTQIVAYPVNRSLGYAELEILVRAALPTDRPYFLLGESFSGPIAIRIAADPPPGLLGVILCVTFAKNPYPLLGWARPLAAWLPIRSLPRWVRAPFMWGMPSADGAPAQSERATAGVDEVVLRHRIAALLAVDETAGLARIQIPTLVLSASGDRVIPRAATMHMLRTQPRALSIEIVGPHLLLQSRPAECAAAVTRFMRGLKRAGDPGYSGTGPKSLRLTCQCPALGCWPVPRGQSARSIQSAGRRVSSREINSGTSSVAVL